MEGLDVLLILLTADSDSDTISGLSSESSSSDDEEWYLYSVAERGRCSSKPARTRIELYVERTVSNYSSEDFKSHFRLLPETFEIVLSIVGPEISRTPISAGRKPVDAKKQLLLSLWIMATPDSVRSVCDRFDVGRATCLRSLRRVTRALHRIAPQFIKWPQGPQADDVMRTFERNSGFPKIIGAIDGTHINIRAPKNDAKSYINRKGQHSIQVQAVVTHNMLFTSVYAGHAGCVHDARVFRNSPVSGYLADAQCFPGDSHLVGDGAYGIHPRLMTPFRNNGHLSPRQKNFNRCLSSARVAVERAFGLWKCRWRRVLDCLPMTRVDKIPEFLLATCVLHNICIMHGDFVPFQQPLRVMNRGQLIPGNTEMGSNKRLSIMHSLPMRDN